jgi:hypothetical protein
MSGVGSRRCLARRGVTCMRRRAWILAFVLAALHGPTASATPVQLDPLPRQFIEPGCGCTFYKSSGPGAQDPVLRWTHADRKHAIMKLDGEVRQMTLIQEKRLPMPRAQQGYGERLVLIFTDDRFRVEVPSSVTNACASDTTGCGPTRYKARLIVRRGADAARVVDGSGACGC